MQRAGLLCPENVLGEVKADAAASAPKRREAVIAKDQKLIADARAALLRLFPRVPLESAERILEHGFLKGSGRVGRTALDIDKTISLAVEADIRHTQTPYETFLKEYAKNGENARTEARKSVKQMVEHILRCWRSQQADTSTIDHLGASIGLVEMGISREHRPTTENCVSEPDIQYIASILREGESTINVEHDPPVAIPHVAKTLSGTSPKRRAAIEAREIIKTKMVNKKLKKRKLRIEERGRDILCPSSRSGENPGSTSIQSGAQVNTVRKDLKIKCLRLRFDAMAPKTSGRFFQGIDLNITRDINLGACTNQAKENALKFHIDPSFERTLSKVDRKLMLEVHMLERKKLGKMRHRQLMQLRRQKAWLDQPSGQLDLSAAVGRLLADSIQPALPIHSTESEPKEDDDDCVIILERPVLKATRSVHGLTT